MTNKDISRLYDILEAIESINSFSHDGIRDEKTLAAVERKIEVIGEAVNHLSDALKSAHPEIEWRQIIGMRNMLIHEYRKTIPDKIWFVVDYDIPNLKDKIQTIIKQLENK